MRLAHIIICALVQGLAELLPVSSSAHVIAAAKLLHEDPTTPQFGLLLVMLHTGTMFAVILYFWRMWKRTFFSSGVEFMRFATKITIATGITGALGWGLMKGIEKKFDKGYAALVSWSLSSTSGRTPTATTPLTHIVATDQPEHPLFHVGDMLTFTPNKGGDSMPAQTFAVTATKTLGDFRYFLQSSIGMDMLSTTSPPENAAKVLIAHDDADAAAVKIVIRTKNGSENRVKFTSSSLVNQNNQMVMGFWDINKAEVEHLFKRMDLIALALAAAGVLILISGIVTIVRKRPARKGIRTSDSIAIGFIQGLSLPFRGFSRSGVTISVGLLRNIARTRAEEFSFALAVVLTPPVIAYEAYRLVNRLKMTTPIGVHMSDFTPGLQGMAFAFLGGLVALAVLSKLLEKGQWWLFGIYCFGASAGIYWMHLHGFGN